MKKKTLLIKIGGSILADLGELFFDFLNHLHEEGNQLVIVHGGGPEINHNLQTAGIAFQQVNGIRITGNEAAAVVQSTLAGQINPRLVRQLNTMGFPAAGLTGNDAETFQCSFLNKEMYGYVGRIDHVDTKLITILLESGFIPVLASIGSVDHHVLNINADTAASELAKAIQADRVIFLSNVDGIQIDGTILSSINEAEIQAAIENEEITGGMIPKVQAAVDCLIKGASEVLITGKSMKGTIITKQEVTA